MNCKVGDKKIKYILSGRVDSNNSEEFENFLFKHYSENAGKDIIMDAADLQYISSAGLRALLKLKKKSGKNISISNVSDEIFDIFAVTGFIDIFDVSKKLKVVYLDNAHALMKSINGQFYRKSADTMVKVYRKGISIDEIKKERELAKKALVLGVPTLIPFELCSIGSSYGLIFEASDTTSLSKIIQKNPASLEEYADRFANFLKELHSIEVNSDAFPSIKDKYREWMEDAEGWLKPADRDSINKLLDGIPDSRSYLHGNITLSNVTVHDGELMLLDMSASSYGHPIFDLQGIYASLVESSAINCSSMMGISIENCRKFWDAFFPIYMSGSSEGAIENMQMLLKRYYILNQKLLSVLENK